MIKKNISVNALVQGANFLKKTDGEVAGAYTKKQRGYFRSPVTAKKSIPTLTLVPTSKPKITPSQTNTPTPSPKSVKIVSTSTPKISSSTSSNLLKQINEFRSSNGKTPLSEEPTTCAFAALRAGEIVSNFSHYGFRNRIDSKTLPYPGYSSVAENIAYNGDSMQVVTGWIKSPGHAENMLKDVPYGCVGNSGIHYTFEAWKP